jgi:hypothetical protein
MRHLMFAIGMLAAATSFGCTNGNSSNTPTGPTPNLVTETFPGSITQGTTTIHTFTVNNAGYTLAAGFTSITPTTVPSLGVGIGSWDPTAQTCSLNVLQNNTATSGSTAISYTDNTGSLVGMFCARVYNGGAITDPNLTVNYTLQIEHY